MSGAVRSTRFRLPSVVQVTTLNPTDLAPISQMLAEAVGLLQSIYDKPDAELLATYAAG